MVLHVFAAGCKRNPIAGVTLYRSARAQRPCKWLSTFRVVFSNVSPRVFCSLSNQLTYTLCLHSRTAVESIRIFKCKQLRYVWDEHAKAFNKLRGLDSDVPSIVLHQNEGLTEAEQYARRLVYGPNTIYIPLKSVMTLLFLEALNPFYVFQVFSVCLWFSYNYYYYAVVIILMTAFGITMSIIQTRKVFVN